MDEAAAHPSPRSANLNFLWQVSEGQLLISALAAHGGLEGRWMLCSLWGPLGGKVLGNTPRHAPDGKLVSHVTLTQHLC